MCGIAVCVCSAEVSDTVLKSPEWLQLQSNNTKRGPDTQHKENFDVQIQSNSTLHLSFFVSTLHLRGPKPVVQPHASENAVFCWNGEVFDGIEVSLEQNDGSVLFSALEGLEDINDIYRLLSQVEGPYAFVYYQRKHRRLYFGRDPLGRKSLLLHYPTEKHPFFSLSSVSIGPGYDCIFEELDSKYIYGIDLSSSSLNRLSLDITIHRKARIMQPGSPSFAAVLPVNNNVPEDPPLPDMNLLREDLSNAVDRLFDVLDKSIDAQVRNIPPPAIINGSRVAVLFSGGIDSTMIAFLADRHVPSGEPIDLLNVAFENPRRLRLNTSRNSTKSLDRNEKEIPVTSPSNIGEIAYDVPDRLSGLEELGELRRLCPNRQWNFVEINVTYTESSQAKEAVQCIMYPSKTVMDLSLGLALHFLSKASGTLHNSEHPTHYVSSAKVLLNGLGSDELLGGYVRHQSVFKAMGWSGLINELQLELDRIPARNLGRDDRIISHHGKETRHPFLSLSVVNTISQMSAHLKTDPRLGPGSGDKMLLRLLAKKLGLELASTRKKRAMQFGTSSARLEVDVGGRDGDKSLYEER